MSFAKGAIMSLSRLTTLLSDAPPRVLELERERNRRVHWSSLVSCWSFHGIGLNDFMYGSMVSGTLVIDGVRLSAGIW